MADKQQLEHIGAYLRELREHYRLSAQDVAARLHIRPRYIEALEEGRIDELPGKVYTLGYVQTYAEFLGADAQKIIAEYQEIQQLDTRESFKIIEPHQPQGAPALRLLAGCAILLLLAFIIWQVMGQHEHVETTPMVEAVPEQMMASAARTLIVTSHNKQCLDASFSASYPPCFYGENIAKAAAFELPHYSSMLELH